MAHQYMPKMFHDRHKNPPTPLPTYLMYGPLIPNDWHCVKSVRIWSYSDLHFPTFGLNMGRYSVSLRIQSKCWKMQITIIPNMDTFYEVWKHLIKTKTSQKKNQF